VTGLRCGFSALDRRHSSLAQFFPNILKALTIAPLREEKGGVKAIDTCTHYGNTDRTD
jgi:hypothetical protein